MFFADGVRYQQDVVDVLVVDTMGAGDSFIGSFLTEYYTHKDIKKALQSAAVSASVTCGFYGGFEYPKQLD
nr:PfkB family carbohydrate kinase [Lentibacillus sp. JNUCC-1]